MADSFLSAAEIADLRQDYASGMQTVQEWTGGPAITIVRQDGTTLGTLVCISIRLADRQPANTGAGTPSTGTEQSGTVTAWESDLPATAIRQGDRFLWNGMPCVVQFGPIEELQDSGVVRIAFVIAQGRLV